MRHSVTNSILVDAIVSLAKQMEDDAHDLSMTTKEDEYEYYEDAIKEGLTTIVILACLALTNRKGGKQ